MVNKKDTHWDEAAEHPMVAPLELWGRKFLYQAASAIIGRNGSIKNFNLSSVKRLLIVKEPYRMGDLIQITPTLRMLKKSFPQIHMGLVIQDRNYPIFKNNPDVDQIFLYEKRKFNRYPWKTVLFMQKIRRERFDLAVTLETQRTHLTNDLIAHGSGAPYRLRYDGSAFNNPVSNIFYNLITPFDPSLEHETEKNFAVFKAFGLILDNPTLQLHVSNAEMRKAKTLIHALFNNGHTSITQSFIAIHPGAYKIKNRWPLDHYLEIGHALQARGKHVLFILGPSEVDWKYRIGHAGFPIVSGVSILELAGILKLSEGVICNDTGVLHIAAGVGKKTIALFGETNTLRWRPPGDLVQVIQTQDKDISAIQIENVLEVIAKQFELSLNTKHSTPIENQFLYTHQNS